MAGVTRDRNALVGEYIKEIGIWSGLTLSGRRPVSRIHISNCEEMTYIM